jgi:hypothetical protein
MPRLIDVTKPAPYVVRAPVAGTGSATLLATASVILGTTPVDGQIAFATDTHYLFVASGGIWWSSPAAFVQASGFATTYFPPYYFGAGYFTGRYL